NRRHTDSDTHTDTADTRALPRPEPDTARKDSAAPSAHTPGRRNTDWEGTNRGIGPERWLPPAPDRSKPAHTRAVSSWGPSRGGIIHTPAPRPSRAATFPPIIGGKNRCD